jgi:putative membrane-bound dehydrogenase-like protein
MFDHSMLRSLLRLLVFLISVTILSSTSLAQKRNNKKPEVPDDLQPHIEILEPGVKLTLLAEHPGLVTPTGIDIDDQGQIWVIACHTHFRPEEYRGPEHDEILVFDKHGGNRRLFYNKTDATMHVEIGSEGWIYLVERDRILRVKDSDADGMGDLEETLITLDTVADYPHNGLSGLTWHPDGNLFFSLGENYGKQWSLTSDEGVILTGRGEGGIFCCNAQGSQLRRVAKGFWNPFGLMIRDDGEIFAVENDPGSRPPCRLLNIIEGADYGYQRAYGNDSVHPFVAWNGELRGTLGMIHPTSEAPCALVELGGGALVPSWSNHCIDFFPLIRKGAGYTSERIEILRGSDYFRPVSIAPGPDGAFYLTDWVYSSYQLHERGRLWKLEIDRPNAKWLKLDRDPITPAGLIAKKLRDDNSPLTLSQRFEYAQSNDPYLSEAALAGIACMAREWSANTLKNLPHDDRLWALIALRRIDMSDDRWVNVLQDDPSTDIQFERLRWIADAVLTEYLPEVEQLLSKPDLEFRLFEAALATLNTLRGTPEAGVTDIPILLKRLNDDATPARVKGYILRLLPNSEKQLSIAMLQKALKLNDDVLSQEVIYRLTTFASDESFNMLAEIAAHDRYSDSLRADALNGLAISLSPKHQNLLLQLANHPRTTIRNEALRSLRARALSMEERSDLKGISDKYPDSNVLVMALLDPMSIQEKRPSVNDTSAWLQHLKAIPGQPNLETGRRIFFHSKIASCSSCHRYYGRGSVVGPDLSFVSRQGTQRVILQSILEPNREVAPQFYTTILELDDGKIFTGILLRSSSIEVYRDQQGKERTFQKSEIVRRKERKTSLMPTGLVEQFTDDELRDLLAFLTSATPP